MTDVATKSTDTLAPARVKFDTQNRNSIKDADEFDDRRVPPISHRSSIISNTTAGESGRFPESRRSSIFSIGGTRWEPRTDRLSISGRSSMKVRKVLSQEQRRELGETFNLFDTDGSGTMEPGELRVVLYALGFDASTEHIERMVADYLEITEEEAAEASLTQEQFMQLITEKMMERDSPEKMQLAFKQFDPDNRGRIGFKEIRKVSKELQDSTTDAEIQMIIDELDKDGDGEIGLDDWLHAMSQSK